MNDAIVHAHPAATTVTEDVQSLVTDGKRFYHENKEVIIIVGTLAFFSLFVNRSILRRELKRLHFTAKFYPSDMFGDEILSTLGE